MAKSRRARRGQPAGSGPALAVAEAVAGHTVGGGVRAGASAPSRSATAVNVQAASADARAKLRRTIQRGSRQDGRVTAVNIHRPDFDDSRDEPGFRARRARVGHQTSTGADIVLQPDSGKLGAYERLPEGGERRFWFRRGDEVGYFEGETPPG